VIVPRVVQIVRPRTQGGWHSPCRAGIAKSDAPLQLNPVLLPKSLWEKKFKVGLPLYSCVTDITANVPFLHVILAL